MYRPRVPPPPGVAPRAAARAALLRAAPLVALVLAAPARAARAQLVMGPVVDSATRRPLPAVAVQLVRRSGAGARDSVVARGLTQGDGTVTLPAPAPGRYRVRIVDGLVGPPLALASADTADQHLYPIARSVGGARFESQVDEPARSVPGSVDLRYPVDLFRANVTGCATLELVVDTAGRTEKGSARPVAATQRAFARAGVASVAKARFTPAVRDGRPVRAVVVVPLIFEIVGQRVADRSPCEAAGGMSQDAVTVTASYTSPP